MKLAVLGVVLYAVTGHVVSAGEFQYRIAPLLAREGCAAAECHGGATGRGGFKLSLFATNHRADYEALTQDLFGRRIDHTNPGRSLLLRKPSRDGIKHGGGRVIEKGGPVYEALYDWIEQGALFEKEGEFNAPLTDLRLSIENEQAMVRAFFGESKGMDVTQLSRFESTNPSVAVVDSDGRVQRVGKGSRG